MTWLPGWTVQSSADSSVVARVTARVGAGHFLGRNPQRAVRRRQLSERGVMARGEVARVETSGRHRAGHVARVHGPPADAHKCHEACLVPQPMARGVSCLQLSLTLGQRVYTSL